MKSPTVRAATLKLCQRDMIYWWAGFCWLIEVRSEGSAGARIPFIPYDYEIEVGRKLEESLEKQNDLAIAKSRDMGMTWVPLLTILHKWLFWDGFTALLSSKKAHLVDQIGNWNTLFEKLRYNLKRMPKWMLPAGFDWREHSKLMLLKNPAAGGEIEGATTTGEVGRSGRYNVSMVDEHAAIHPNDQLKIEGSIPDAAACSWYISTPRGNQNMYYKKCHSEEIERVDIHWWRHPVKGLAAWQEIEFKNEKTIRGKIRSPWYDTEVRRRNQPEWMIAQELDISFSGSVDTIIDNSILNLWRNDEPEIIEMRYDKHRLDGEPALIIFEAPQPEIQYIIGGDPSGGTETGSNTGVQGMTVAGLRQVFEYQGRIGVDILSTLLYVLGREYNWAHICVEANMGVSTLTDLFEGHIDRLGLAGQRGAVLPPYPEELIIRHCHPDGRATERLGVQTTNETKRFMAYSLLEPYARNQDMLIRGRRTISELSGFRDEGQKIHNPDGDDLVMALGVLLYGHRFMDTGTGGAPIMPIVG